MDPFLENAQRIFDVAKSGQDGSNDGENQDFALLIRPDGVLHFVMESPFSIEESRCICRSPKRLPDYALARWYPCAGPTLR